MRMCNAQIVIRKLANNLKYLYIHPEKIRNHEMRLVVP